MLTETVFGPVLRGVPQYISGMLNIDQVVGIIRLPKEYIEAQAVGRVVFVGNLDRDERTCLEGLTGALIALGWTLEVRPAVPRVEALRLIGSADGMLLLSSSMASLPAKLFDYLPSGRPILMVAPEGSAVWEVAEELPQAVPVSGGGSHAIVAVRSFLARCQEPDPEWAVPESFSEDYVRAVFLGALPE